MWYLLGNVLLIINHLWVRTIRLPSLLQSTLLCGPHSSVTPYTVLASYRMTQYETKSLYLASHSRKRWWSSSNVVTFSVPTVLSHILYSLTLEIILLPQVEQSYWLSNKTKSIFLVLVLLKYETGKRRPHAVNKKLLNCIFLDMEWYFTLWIVLV